MSLCAATYPITHYYTMSLCAATYPITHYYTMSLCAATHPITHYYTMSLCAATYPITHYYTMSLCAAHAASHGMCRDWLFMIACYTQCTQHAIITGTSPSTHPSNKLAWPDSISVLLSALHINWTYLLT